MNEPLDVLFVCTGNICRSPMAERLLVARLLEREPDEAESVRVGSAGTWGHEGSPMEPNAEHALMELGADPRGFRGRELAAEMVADADLVLTATREHRAAAVTLVPRAASRTFTLLEFARLVRAVDPEVLPDEDLAERGRALVRAAAGKRGMVPSPAPGEDDLSDPIGAPIRAFRACAAVIDEAVEAIVDRLARR